MIKIEKKVFGVTKDKKTSMLYTLKNDNGMTLCVTDYGAAVVSVVVPDKYGNPTDVVLGYKSLSDYEAGKIFMGATVGRYAGRIKNAAFTIDKKTYTIRKNDGENHLHGNLSEKVFEGHINNDSVIMSYKSLPQDEGYPGTVDITVTYTLNEDNSFSIEHTATTDRDTIVNLINHTYFNLNGQTGGDILSHCVRLNADKYLETDKETLFTGRIAPVAGTPLDFSSFKTMGQDLTELSLKNISGYDHTMVIKAKNNLPFAEVVSDKTGIKLTAFTNCPAFNFYGGYYIDTDPVNNTKCQKKYQRYGGLCFETRYIDLKAPLFLNILRENQTLHQKTVFLFTNY